MARKDSIHPAVKNALVKDGWTITAEPLRLEYGDVNLEIDLAAEPTLAAERGGQRIAVEIKSFLNPSLMNDLKVAVGQYHIYLTYLKLIEPERKLFVAISTRVRRRIISLKGLEILFETYRIPFIVVNLKKEEIVEWIS